MTIGNTLFTSLSERGACCPAEEKCLRLLDRLGIPYEGLTHAPGDTIEACAEIEKKLGAPIVKNLFLCNRQKTAYYLLMLPGDKPFKTKYLSQQIGSARLSFADADSMERLLGLRPGSVSVLGLANDAQHLVRPVFDEEILPMCMVGFHPCRNTSTLKLRLRDITEVFLPYLGLTPAVVSLPAE